LVLPQRRAKPALFYEQPLYLQHLPSTSSFSGPLFSTSIQYTQSKSRPSSHRKSWICGVSSFSLLRYTASLSRPCLFIDFTRQALF
jgi:hypothetical protein